jgi:hypothetical protein
MVVLGGSAAAPELLARSRVQLIDDHDPESKQPYQVSLPSILSSHALIHAADGDHFRNALCVAAEQCRLQVCRIPAKGLEAYAGKYLRRPTNRILETVNQLTLGKGPPWGADQKKAALPAWALLADGAG